MAYPNITRDKPVTPATTGFDITTAKPVVAGSGFDITTAKPVVSENIDVTKGAPLSVRSAVASAQRPEDKLTALQSFYPDAQLYKGDNYVFTDPKTNRPTLFNPEGLDYGDFAEFGRGAAELAGGGIGGAIAVVGGQLGPQVAIPEEIFTVPAAVGLGATIAGDLYDMMLRGIYDVKDTRSSIEIVGQDVSSIMLNAVGQKLGEVVEQGVRSGVSAGGRLVGKTSDAIRDAFTRIGTEPTAGAVSGSRFIQGVEQALAKLPSSADIIGKKYNATIDAMDAFAKRTASRLTTKEGSEQVGRSISKGVDDFVNRFQAQASTLYDDVWKKIPKTKRVPIANFTKELDSTVGQFGDDPAFQGILDSPVIKKLAEAAGETVEKEGGVTVGTLKALRTKIGSELQNKSLLTDTTHAELKKLYGALSEDIKLAAEASNAGHAFSRANNYWKAGRGRIDDVLDPMVNSKNAEKIYNKVFGPDGKTLKNIGTSDIRTLMKSMPKQAQQDVSAEFVKRMGMSTPGTTGFEGAGGFSPARFLTQYNTMSKGAKSAVFDRVPGLRAAMDDLAMTSAAVKDTHAMANNSGTAGQLMFMNLLTGGIGGLYGGTEGALVGVSAVMSPYGAAKLMTSPRFVRWLADAGKTVATDPNTIGPFLGRLTAIAEFEPQIKEEIYQYAESLRDVIKQPETKDN